MRAFRSARSRKGSPGTSTASEAMPREGEGVGVLLVPAPLPALLALGVADKKAAREKSAVCLFVGGGASTACVTRPATTVDWLPLLLLGGLCSGDGWREDTDDAVPFTAVAMEGGAPVPVLPPPASFAAAVGSASLSFPAGTVPSASSFAADAASSAPSGR